MAEGISNLLLRLAPKKKFVIVKAYSELQRLIIINGHPTAFILDPNHLGISGTQAITQLKRNYYDAPIVIFTSIPQSEAGQSCLSAGADFYIEKNISSSDFSAFLAREINWKIDTANSPSPSLLEGYVKFTKRQKQLIVLIDSGLNNDKIAEHLGISEHTVKVHLWRLYKKLNLSSRTQLIKFCRDNGHL